MDSVKQRALSDAAWDGDFFRVCELVADPDVDIRAFHSNALLHAAHRGHQRCVEVLLGAGSDPLAHRSEALLRAAHFRRGRCVDLLAPISDTSGWFPHEWESVPVAMRNRILRHVTARC